MGKLVQDLEARLEGEVFDSEDALDYFSTDGSIFTQTPKLVVYPKHSKDVQEVVRLAAEHKVGVTARGKGTDQAGGALGEGIMLVFPAHMNRMLRLESKYVIVQPGLIYKDLQNTLHTHERYLPPYPSSMNFSTIGGAVANNACGEKTIKYGCTRDYIKRLKVVLADGSQVVTRPLSRRELNRKKGQRDLEGEIYRKLDGLLLDNKELIKQAPPATTKNVAGYALWQVKKDGSFDLSQLLAGSQGTLGIITEMTLATKPYNPRTSLVVAYCDSLEKAGEAVMKILPLKPSAMEVVDYYLLDFLKRNKPEQLKGLVPEPLPKIVLLIEFDDASQVKQVYKRRKAERILKKLGQQLRSTTNDDEQEDLWRIRRSAAAVIWMTHGPKKALPMIEDGVVPVAKLPEFLKAVYKLLQKHKLEIAVWGHAGNANFHLQPFMDLSKTKDREKVFKLMDEYYDLLIKMGGSTCGEHNDGLARAPYLPQLYGEEVYGLFEQVKQIFDPQNILNPGKKIGVTKEQLKPLLRKEYSMKHLYDHMPHS